MNEPSRQPLDPLALRREFACYREAGAPLVYLDSASSSLKPDRVIDAVADHYRRTPANIHRGLYPMSEAATAAYENARERVRRFINAASLAEVIFTSGTTDAINLVAHGFGNTLQAGDEILITGLEHHANIVPWQLLRERRGIVLKVVPITPTGEVDPADFRAALSPRTRLAAFTAVSNALGTETPVAELVALARAAGAATLVDAAQAMACCPVDVQAWGCDFLAFSGHKLFGPNGVGVLHGRRERLAAMSPFKGGGDMIRSVTYAHTTYNDLPHKFEAGTPPIAAAVGLGAAIQWVEELGLARIAAHEAALLAAASAQLAAWPGVHLVGQPRRRRGIVSFQLAGIHPHDVGTLLGADGIAVRTGHHCAQPLMDHLGLPATVRASFSVYNTPDDITALLAGIWRVQEVFG